MTDDMHEACTASFAKKTQISEADHEESGELLSHLSQIHTTTLGVDRIKKNLALHVDDVVDWCKEKIQSPNGRITRKGKNWYIAVDGCEITVNAQSYTIITAHKTTKGTGGASK